MGYHALLQGVFPNIGIEFMSLMSPALAGELFTTSTTWEAQNFAQCGARTHDSGNLMTLCHHTAMQGACVLLLLGLRLQLSLSLIPGNQAAPEALLTGGGPRLT